MIFKQNAYHSLFFIVIFIVKSVVASNAFSPHIINAELQIKHEDDYLSKDIKFSTEDDKAVLAGTLIYPNNDFEKVVIIVPGNGKDKRNTHAVLAEALLKNQIAVFRFDDRGVGKSKGKPNETASSLTKDLIAACQHLKQEEILSNKKFGAVGHSLGGIATISALGKGIDFDFLIQMATPVENNGAFLTYQAETNIVGFYTVKGKSTKQVIHFINSIRQTIQQDDDFNIAKKKAKMIMLEQNFKKGKHLINKVLIDLMQQNHESTYQNSKVPILYIIGSKDQQVSADNAINTLNKLNNGKITIELVENTDHYLTDTSEKSAYNISDKALDKILNWLLAH